MDEDEAAIFILCILASGIAAWCTSTVRLHPLFLRKNPGPGLLRLAALSSMPWIVYVQFNHRYVQIAPLLLTHEAYHVATVVESV